MPSIDDSDPIFKQVSLNKEDIAAFRRVLDMVAVRPESAYKDALDIKQVAEILETAERAHEITQAAIKRYVKERKDAGDPAFQAYKDEPTQP